MRHGHNDVTYKYEADVSDNISIMGHHLSHLWWLRDALPSTLHLYDTNHTNDPRIDQCRTPQHPWAYNNFWQRTYIVAFRIPTTPIHVIVRSPILLSLKTLPYGMFSTILKPKSRCQKAFLHNGQITIPCCQWKFCYNHLVYPLVINI